MSTPRKTLHGSLKERLTDVRTGLYMISSTCGLVDAVCFLSLGGVFAEMMTGNLLLMALNRHRQVDGAEQPATSPPS